MLKANKIRKTIYSLKINVIRNSQVIMEKLKPKRSQLCDLLKVTQQFINIDLLLINNMKEYNYYPHLTEKETEAHTDIDLVTSLMSHS